MKLTCPICSEYTPQHAGPEVVQLCPFQANEHSNQTSMNVPGPAHPRLQFLLTRPAGRALHLGYGVRFLCGLARASMAELGV